MKIFFCIAFSFATSISLAQTFSGESTPGNFQVPQGNSKLSEISKPVVLRIRQEQIFSNTSQPTNFSIGQSKKSLQQKEVVRTISTIDSKSTLIPELESSVPKYFSLIIGIDDYKFNNDRLRDLNKAISDAGSLQNILTESFNFQSEHSILLTNPSRQEIIRQLEILASKISAKDNLLIFYAGHGVWDERIKVGYWLPSDAMTDDKSSWISNSTIRDYVAGINSKHTLLITDACFSGSIFKTRDMDLSDYGMSNLYRLSSRKAMTSGTLTTVPDESKFMQYFIKRLTDTEGKYVSARQLFYGLETAVLNNTNTVPQFGVIQDTGDEGGDFIFIRRQKK